MYLNSHAVPKTALLDSLALPFKRRQEELKDDLALLVGSDIQLSLHKNRSTLVSIRPDSDYLEVRLHQQFTSAARPVLKSLAAYIKGARDAQTVPLKRFLHEVICTSSQAPQSLPIKIITQGLVWDLQALYHKLENTYFNEPLNLSVTWFGKRSRIKQPVKCTLGLYYDMFRAIKIHYLLDRSFVPQYVIEYVLYHEMVHAVCPTEVDASGRVFVHTSRFHEVERRYPWIKEAEMWLHENIHLLFTSTHA